MSREPTDSNDLRPQSSRSDEDWQYNRVVLMGELEWVQSMIYELHWVGIAEVNS